MNPYYVSASATVVEVWSGYRIQFGGMERHGWQKVLKADMKAALVKIALPTESFAGYYDTTDPAVSDVENSLFTNMTGSLPSGITLLRFERGSYGPPTPPVPIDLVGGHLHYYRYTVGGGWTTWDADKVLARWDRVPRRMPLDDSAGPAWFAIREGCAGGRVNLTGEALSHGGKFGVRLVVHATRQGPRNAIAISENMVEGCYRPSTPTDISMQFFRHSGVGSRVRPTKSFVAHWTVRRVRSSRRRQSDRSASLFSSARLTSGVMLVRLKSVMTQADGGPS